ncbi:hypothetical protein GS399_15905 [Pedobacter sp. HMF7647]|uniref:DUF4760 domain-containing protein n=1 Tax=Hufsiella arboris TaxID=2695275 RepID=A0A7K1YDH8_9SPHI|nr:hypothetical protein [Hufsiella arboris]MXV52460.1 hypothetical protein [Hufsiella arboris]
MYLTDINHFGPFSSDVWGTVGDWSIVTATVVTGIIIFKTLRLQYKSDQLQIERNDVDVIFMLINQLEQDYSNYSIVLKETRVGMPSTEKIMHGYIAMCNYFEIIGENDEQYIVNYLNSDRDTDKLLSVIRSFNLVKKKIAISTISNSTKMLFEKKLEIFYSAKFSYPLNCLLKNFTEADNQVILEIKRFKDENSRIK